MANRKGLNIKASSRREVIKGLKKFGDEARDYVMAVTESTAQGIERDAANNVPVNFGSIKQSINADRVSDLLWKVSVNYLPLGAYVEFGTGTKVKVAPEWSDMAWEFYKNGEGYLAPRPYLYPAYVKGRERYERDLKDELDRLVKSYNNR